MTNGQAMYLQRSEAVNGVNQNELLTDALSPTALTVQTPQGVNVSVVGINFQSLTKGVVMITLVVSKSTSNISDNTSTIDNTTVITRQATVQMVNN